MKHPANQTPTPDDDGINRRGFLECMTWAGTGVLWMLSGGLPRSISLASAEAASALTSWASPLGVEG
jgi:3',5'-cyclic-AMP phosphodiesterase